MEIKMQILTDMFIDEKRFYFTIASTETYYL